MANILIYIPGINQDYGGTRQYAVTLIKMLHEIKSNQYFIYHDVNDSEVIQAIAGKQGFKLVTTSDIEVKEVVYKNVTFQRLNGLPVLGKLRFKRKFIITTDLETYCHRNKIKIIHCPYQFLPQVKGVKLITTLHDIQEIHFPEFFSAEQRAYRATNYLDFLRRADSVVVSYSHIKQDLLHYFDVPEQKITILLLKMEKLWFDKFSQADIITLPLNLAPKQYLLYPANAWKHKNHLFLLDVLAYIRDKFNLHINVFFTGNFNITNGQLIIEKSTQLNLENQVSFLGVVEENILYSLYKQAVGVVIPTLYEAGSFPLMESILLNVPVICSNVTSLPETIGNVKFVFDPENINDFSEKVIQLWKDEEFRKYNLEQLKLQADLLKKNNPFPNLQKLYRELSA